jgi:hypothetical protein
MQTVYIVILRELAWFVISAGSHATLGFYGNRDILRWMSCEKLAVTSALRRRVQEVNLESGSAHDPRDDDLIVRGLK